MEKTETRSTGAGSDHVEGAKGAPASGVGQSAPKRLAISSPYLHRLQRRHFLLFDVLPFLGTLFAIWHAFRTPITALDIGLFAGMWLLTGLGLSVGFHRLFCHRAFKTGPTLRALFVISGCMAARSSMITWASQHRRHHQLADHPGDVHSPNLFGDGLKNRFRGWLYSHITWMWRHEYPNIVHYGPDLLADKAAVGVDRYYNLWIIVGLVLPALIGGVCTASLQGALTGFLWGGVVRMFVVAQQISALNSLNHMFGTRPFRMPDNRSHNNALFGLITWGEGWHNNHHAFSSSATFGFHWYQIDPGYWFIRVLEKLGLAWDVARPSKEKIESLYRKFSPQRDHAPSFDADLEPSKGASEL